MEYMTTYLSRCASREYDLWKYCTKEQIHEMLLSFRLLEGAPVREEKKLACLYAVSNHVRQHYHTAQIVNRTRYWALYREICCIMCWMDFQFQPMLLPTKRKRRCWITHDRMWEENEL